MVRLFVQLGIEKVRLTGGEPLLRGGIVDFVRQIAKLRTLNGETPDIAVTTNGHLLAEMAQPLKDAGLRRATVSMDAVDRDKFARITRVANGYDNVLAGIRAARRAGLEPVKVNCVLLRGFNDDQIRTCLFSLLAHDLAGRMHAGADDAALAAYIHSVIGHKEARHHIGEPGFVKPSRSMVHIGG